jgi:hypothetical protein
MSYWEIQKLNGFAVNQYQYSSNPVAHTQTENPWVAYFNKTNSQQKSQVSTSDAISQLNAMHEQEQVNGEKKLSPEEAKEAKKKADAQKKLAKLTEQLEKNSVVNITQKHINALNMINDCSQLQHLVPVLNEKILGAANQSSFMLNKLALAQMKGDMDSSQILKVVEEVKKTYEELKQNWKKISKGVIKTGAYAEAYVKVDDDKKKEKYEKEANKIVASLPDAFKNESEAAAIESEIEELNKSKESDTNEASLEAENLSGEDVSAQVEDVPVETTQEPENPNPFASSDKESEDVEEESNDDSADLNANSSEKDKTSEDDPEIKDLKKEVQEELKKQEQNPTSVNPFAEYEKKKIKENKSILGV